MNSQVILMKLKITTLKTNITHINVYKMQLNSIFF